MSIVSSPLQEEQVRQYVEREILSLEETIALGIKEAPQRMQRYFLEAQRDLKRAKGMFSTKGNIFGAAAIVSTINIFIKTLLSRQRLLDLREAIEVVLKETKDSTIARRYLKRVSGVLDVAEEYLDLGQASAGEKMLEMCSELLEKVGVGVIYPDKLAEVLKFGSFPKEPN